MATRGKKKSPGGLIISSVGPPLSIPVQRQITLLGVIVGETLSFIMHAQYAASRGMQALDSFLYPRKGLKGVIPITTHHITLSSVLPKLLWASSILWTGSHSVLYPLQLSYHRIACWITAFSFNSCNQTPTYAYISPLDIWLDYLATRYPTSLIFYILTTVFVHYLPIV
jgi:hypothetical protein